MIPPIQWPEGLSAEQFLANYWQQKPLLLRQAFPDFENPLSADELAGLALDEDIHSRLVLQLSDSHWQLQPGPFTEQELTTLPPRDWSLLVSDIEKHLDGFHSYLEPFRFVPDWQIDDLMISYAPSGASVGAHIDEYDVFLLQASGQREWSIDSSINPPSECIPDLEIKVLQNFAPTESWILQPGDMLYLPPGVPHHGVSCDNDCMTWSIGFRAIGYQELLMGMAQQCSTLLSDSDRYRTLNQALQSHPGEISAQARDDLYTLWKDITNIDKNQFNHLIGNVLTARSSLFPSDDFRQQSDLEDLRASDTVLRDSASRLAYVNLEETYLHADGERYPVSQECAQFLCGGYSYSQATLAPFLTLETDQSCLLSLWKRGILFAEES